MNNFIFSIPTIAYFGKGQIEILGETIKTHGGSKVLLAYGGGSIKQNGIYGAILDQLHKAGLAYVELSGIQPNPRIESVEEGIATYRENGCDFILAVGGGSTLDACKAIAAGVKYEGQVHDLFVDESGISSKITAVAPLATILTMAGTGSELDMGGVITVGEDHKKKVVLHPLLNPKFSILDPEYTYTVPEYHSMAGVADILCHLMEQYFTPEGAAKVQDRMNEGVMKAVLEEAPKILADPKDYDARANIMWASSMALAGFQFVLGKPGFPFPLHGMGHELSSKYDMTHGVTLALLTPSWMRHTMSTAPEHLPVFARFARNVMDVREDDDAKAAEEGVKKLETFYSAIKMPANLREAGVKEEDLAVMAEKAVENGNLGILTSLGKDEVLQIMRMAF
ncbi:iron-containing alcohol dehydrogenase [Geomonas subterranea]|uniref:Iron-containing alcohol dehydrogenase n=1 Tax=Geomonas subterranea TaxID=2847989 RepID=A0ABX8LNJ1_9BACT|nr:iron-containing alcohol dehydrogenase [Geomonas subterranea]QXE92275.1 iron-containing alcohol dehydrogenase [Geomonas subterranea]QXM09626.1 iron-containing alcohol dehydrogenase [Geomonas subterranea]